MTNRKKALIIAGIMSVAALSSCGSQTPAVTSAQETTTAAAEQTTEQTTTAAETTTTAEAQTEAPAAQSDRTDIPESEWEEYQDKIFNANQRSEVFKNHSSLAIESEFGIDPGEYKTNYSWFCEDATYYRATAYEELSFPQMRFELVGIGTDWNPVSTYYLDMIEGGYQYWPVPKEKSDWYDPENEKITEMYIQDGRLYLSSVYTEAGTANYFQVLLPQCEYTGGTLKYFAALDAESLEFIESVSYLEKDGSSVMLITDHYEYDPPAPQGIFVMEGMFERTAPNMVTVTFTTNPGKENEMTKSMTIPANSMANFYAPDISDPECFLDYECTQPYNKDWDMMSDLTLYIREREE